MSENPIFDDTVAAMHDFDQASVVTELIDTRLRPQGWRCVCGHVMHTTSLVNGARAAHTAHVDREVDAWNRRVDRIRTDRLVQRLLGRIGTGILTREQMRRVFTWEGQPT